MKTRYVLNNSIFVFDYNTFAMQNVMYMVCSEPFHICNEDVLQ